MPPHLPLSIVIVALISVANPAVAQPVQRGSEQHESVRGVDGRIEGTIRDENGAAVQGASIVAAGATLAKARTDREGRFSLALPAGPYLIRIVRSDGIAAFLAFVRLQAEGSLERNVTLTSSGQFVIEPDDAAAEDESRAQPSDESRNRSDIAWRLRHLTRTVLRDTSGVPSLSEDGDDPGLGEPALDAQSVVGWVLEGPTRAATAFFTDTDFTGHVNLVTENTTTGTDTPASPRSIRGVADVAVGAAVGQLGDWSVRGLMAADGASSWTLLGNYRSRPDRRHVVDIALAYSRSRFVAGRELPVSSADAESQGAGGFRLADRWHLWPALEIDYGIRFDRYDYLAPAGLVSPRAGVRARIAGRTFVTATTRRRMIAPGEDQFLPPSVSDSWLPPSRTFSSLSPEERLRPERVRKHAVGIEHTLGGDKPVTVSIEWFKESTDDQMATLFGVDEPSLGGHYYVATAGDVDAAGWRVRVGGELDEHVRGSVEYVAGRAGWSGRPDGDRLRNRMPELVRRGTDRVSILGASLDVTVPRSATDVSLTFRRATAGPGVDSDSAVIGDGRFDLALRQRLPFQPLDAGMLNLLFTLRTLMSISESASIYDELLTHNPPARLTGGLQVEF